MDWSTRRVVDRIAVSLMSAGTLSPTREEERESFQYGKNWWFMTNSATKRAWTKNQTYRKLEMTKFIWFEYIAMDHKDYMWPLCQWQQCHMICGELSKYAIRCVVLYYTVCSHIIFHILLLLSIKLAWQGLLCANQVVKFLSKIEHEFIVVYFYH